MYKEKWNEVYEMEVENIQDVMGLERPEAIRELDNILAHEPDYFFNIMVDQFLDGASVC